MAIELTKANFEEEVLAADVPVIIDFWAVWCGPCRMQSPILEQAEKELGSRAKVCKVNVDEQPDLALKYGIMNIPTLVYMYKGIFQDKFIGLTMKEDIIRKVETVTAAGGDLTV